MNTNAPAPRSKSGITTSTSFAEAKTKISSNILFHTDETIREITEIHSIISETMSRLEMLESLTKTATILKRGKYSTDCTAE